MKKIVLLTLAMLLTFGSFAQDKPVSTEKNVLKVNTLSLFLGTGSIFYERNFSEKLAGQLGVGYLNFSGGDTKFTGLFLTPEVRFYPKKNAIDGMYIAPYFRYQKFAAENSEENAEGTLTAIGGGLAFGRQWITDSGFTMDLFFGGHYGDAKVKAELGADAIDAKFFKGFKPRFGFALGFAF